MVFPVLHGTFGEDGTMQGLLELADLPYVGAGVLASAVSMDKEMMKRVCMERMLPVVDYVVVTRGNSRIRPVCAQAAVPGVREAGEPRVVGGDFQGPQRPGTGGRGGAGRAIRPQDHRGARHRRPRAGVRGAGQRSAAGFPALRDSALARVLRLRRQVPARPGPNARSRPTCLAEKTEELRRLAVECYRAVECEGMARVDFLLEAATGKLYINEINTIPGFTSISMYPKMWEHSGIGFPALIDRLIELALDRDRKQKGHAVHAVECRQAWPAFPLQDGHLRRVAAHARSRRREEVVNGEIRIMPSPLLKHARIIQRLYNRISRQVDEREVEVFIAEFDLIIRRAPLTARVPDLAVFQASTIVERDGRVHSAPQLVAEVRSPANTRRERAEKLADYASLGVAEVWAFSPDDRTVEVLYLENGQYRRQARLTEGVLRPKFFPSVEVPISEIWPK